MYLFGWAPAPTPQNSERGRLTNACFSVTRDRHEEATAWSHVDLGIMFISSEETREWIFDGFTTQGNRKQDHRPFLSNDYSSRRFVSIEVSTENTALRSEATRIDGLSNNWLRSTIVEPSVASSLLLRIVSSESKTWKDLCRSS
jgi:hypothetical protein